MFKKDEIVVNKKGQVCKIIDIVDNFDAGIGEKSYFILVPCFSTNSSIKFYVPCERENLLRYAISKEKIDNLIQKIPTLKPIWFTNPKLRRTKFKEMYDNGDPLDIFRIIISFEDKKKEFAHEGKTLSFTDENFLKEAKRNIYNEFAISLDISSDDVENYIQNKLENA